MDDFDLDGSCECKVVVKIPDVEPESYYCSSCGLHARSQDWFCITEPSNGLRKYVGGDPFWA